MKKATIDRAFLELLLETPDEAIAQVAGEPLPENYTIRFVDNQGANMTLVLPDFIESTELADEDLENISGGANVTLVCIGHHPENCPVKNG